MVCGDRFTLLQAKKGPTVARLRMQGDQDLPG